MTCTATVDAEIAMIMKGVIPAAGAGTRLLPATKQQPKEMLPVFARDLDGQLCLKPFIQLVFEELYETGLREFCFVVGKGKRTIEDHFTLDESYLQRLPARLKAATDLRAFGEKIANASIVFVNQPEPSGFGDAVRCARPFTGTDDFMVHAGDDIVMSRNGDHITRLLRAFQQYHADAAFCVEKVANPKGYGVMTGKEVARNIYYATGVKEKPRHPHSNLAIVAIYLFRSMIHDLIEKVEPDRNGEIQLTSAIASLIREGGNVYGVGLTAEERRIDIGTPSSYWKALSATMKSMQIGRAKYNDRLNSGASASSTREHT